MWESMKKNLELVGVLWNDAHGSSNEDINSNSIVALQEPIQMVSYGLVLVNDEKGILLVSEEYTDREEWRAHKFIPRSLVQETWIVSKQPRRKRTRSKNHPMVPEQSGT